MTIPILTIVELDCMYWIVDKDEQVISGPFDSRRTALDVLLGIRLAGIQERLDRV